jgi:condensin-2 complex subunit D3
MDNTIPSLHEELNATNISNNLSLNTTTNHEKRECFSVIRAHAFVTMGKFCLRDKIKARDHVNIFLREIHVTNLNDTNNSIVSTRDSGNSSVRSNALLVLGDMCVRYTNLVDRHVGTMAACLQVRESIYLPALLVIQ